MSMATVLQNIVTKNLIKYQGLTYGEVLAYDQDTYTVDVQLLKFSQSNQGGTIVNIDYPKIYDIPCLLQGGSAASIKADYAVGDIVIIGHSVSEIDTDGVESSDRSALFNKANAVCLGAVGEAGSSPAILVTESEIIFTVGTTTFTIDASGATVETPAGTVNLATHLHTGNLAAPTSPPTPGT